MRVRALRSQAGSRVACAALALVFFLAFPDHAAPHRSEDSAALIVRGSNAFALNIYAALRPRPENLFLSPFSISTAMGMVYAGARGQTAEQMAGVLHLPSDAQRVLSGFASLLAALQAGSEKHGYRLAIANGMWAQKDYPLRQSFLGLMRSAYAAEIDSADFTHDPQAAAGRINSWVAHHTEDKIKDLFTPSAFNAGTRLVLANAIYFKGLWGRQFDPASTQEAPFAAPGGGRIQVRMMQQQGEFNYLDAGAFQLLELPYQGGTLAMDIFLPRQPDGLTNFEKELSNEILADSLAKLHHETVRLALPRFSLTSSFELTRELAAMGMPRAFSRTADFSGMSKRGQELYLSTVVHKAYVEVNEEGTEAAAATGVGVHATAAIPRIVEFRVDHPCFFLIRDRSSGTFLFLGRLRKPA